MPFREEAAHARSSTCWLLRLSIFGVAVFIFFFSLLFQQSEYIFLFFAITGAIFAGGAGAVIIGGLYWKRGTTPAAWAAMITGSSIAVAGIILPPASTRTSRSTARCSGRSPWGRPRCSTSSSPSSTSRGSSTWIVLLHRGAHVVRGEDEEQAGTRPSRGWRILGVGRDFSRRDRALYVLTWTWTGLWTLVFVVGTVLCLTQDVGQEPWLTYWQAYIYVQIVMSVVVIVWFTLGGVRDVRRMTRELATMDRDDTDDGMVRKAEP